jgi:hypothetical protein
LVAFSTFLSIVACASQKPQFTLELRVSQITLPKDRTLESFLSKHSARLQQQSLVQIPLARRKDGRPTWIQLRYRLESITLYVLILMGRRMPSGRAMTMLITTRIILRHFNHQLY